MRACSVWRIAALTAITTGQRRKQPALELAALYQQRWEVEAVFDEIKVHLLQKRRVLRSKTANLVRQDLWLGAGTLCGALADASGRNRAPPVRSKFVVYRERTADALRTTPIRGIFPQRIQESGGGGLMLYSLLPRTQSALRAKGCITRACSSDAIRHTQAMTVPWRAILRQTSPPNCLRRCLYRRGRYMQKHLTEQYFGLT